MLVGYRVHGIRRPEDLTSRRARDLAHNGWLTDDQYLAILANPHHYRDLRQNLMGADLGNLTNGTEECFFTCDKNLRDRFEFDVEEEYGVQFDNTWRLTVISSYTEMYERREYTMRNANDEKLVHYRPNSDPVKKDKARARVVAKTLNRGIIEHGESSEQAKEEILRGIRGRRGPN